MFNYIARPELLKDRIILVTGAGRGIGAAAARAYAAHGATVLLLGKTESNLTAVYDEIEAAGYPQPAVIPFNLETALPHQYDELGAMIEGEFGRLDGLLHNASIIGPRTPVEQLSGEHFMRVMHINVNATFMLTAALLPLLKLSQDASVVFTSSSVGRKGRAYWGAYGVSKFATEGLMQTLADEVEEAAGRGGQDVDAPGHRLDLLALLHPAEDDGVAGLARALQRGELLVDLDGELAGGGEDEDAGPAAGRRVRVRQSLQRGQREGGRLAGARLGHREDVAAGEERGDGLGLDGGGVGEARVADGGEQSVVETELVEGGLGGHVLFGEEGAAARRSSA